MGWGEQGSLLLLLKYGLVSWLIKKPIHVLMKHLKKYLHLHFFMSFIWISISFYYTFVAPFPSSFIWRRWPGLAHTHTSYASLKEEHRLEMVWWYGESKLYMLFSAEQPLPQGSGGSGQLRGGFQGGRWVISSGTTALHIYQACH